MSADFKFASLLDVVVVTSITSPSFCWHSAFTEVQEPYAVVVLLEKDLIVVDLTQSKYVTVKHTVRHHISESHHRVCKNITESETVLTFSNKVKAAVVQRDISCCMTISICGLS